MEDSNQNQIVVVKKKGDEMDGLIYRLEEGKEYSNYREMCLDLGLKIKDGKSKRIQLDNLRRLCSLGQEGKKYKIETVFEHPLDKIQESAYQPLAMNLLASVFKFDYEESYSTDIFLTDGQLYLLMQMANIKFVDNRFLRHEDWLELDFYTVMNSKLKNIVKRTLKALESNSYIKFNECWIGNVNGKERELSVNELRTVLNNEADVEKEMGENKVGLFLKGKFEAYKTRVNEKNVEDADIKYYYKAYHIIYGSKLSSVTIEVEDGDFKALNDIVKDRHMESVKNRMEYFSNNIWWDGGLSHADKERFFKKEQYELTNAELVEKVIHSDYRVLIDSVKKLRDGREEIKFIE